MANAEKRDALLHILSVNRSVFQFPGETFRRYLQSFVPGTKTKVDAVIDKYKRDVAPQRAKLKETALKISPLSIGLYNATVDTKSPIDIRSILEKVKENGLVSEDGIKVTEFVIRYGKFQTAVKYTSEYGLQGDETKPFVSADFKLKITKGGTTKGASFSYYASGKIRFSGGHLDSLDEQPKELIDFFSKNYHKIGTRSFVLNNVTSEFKLGFPLKTSLIYDMFSEETVKSYFKGYHVVAKYNNKKFLYLTFSEEFSLVVSNSGVIQIQGTTKVEDAYKVSKDFFTALKDNDFLEVSKAQNIRINSPKKTKIARRMNNKPAPNITRRGTTCPVGRRPNPYSYEGKCPQGDTCFIKPNPQGQPCCYTKPKDIKYSRNKVENAYTKAGVRIPNSVRQFFGMGLATVGRPVNVANVAAKLNIRVQNNKINSRQCLRYTKVALVDIATRLKIPLPSKLTKPILCDLIKKSVPSTNTGAKVGNKLVSGTNGTLRLGKRLCHSYAKATLEKFARALGIKNVLSLDKAELCKAIEKASRTKNVHVSPPKPKFSSPKPKSPSPKPKSPSPKPKSPSPKPKSPRFKNTEDLYNYIEQVGGKQNKNKNFNYFMRGPRHR
jgi:TATA-box binding protein (TBP) (component of TFIID and TFIIIB)